MDTPVVPFRCALPSTSGLNNPEGLEASSSPVDKAPPKRPRHLRGTTWHLWLVYINVALYGLVPFPISRGKGEREREGERSLNLPCRG